MAVSTYKPEWQETTPVRFKSRNPLIKEVELDTYYVKVLDMDSNGQPTGTEHKELCITHSSLLRWYQDHIPFDGPEAHLEMLPSLKNGTAVLCTMEKCVNSAEMLALAQKGLIPKEHFTISALGEASCDNCSTDIAKKNLTTTAENRAFDRALIRYLNLDLTGFDGSGRVYSSSEDIGKPVPVASAESTPPQPVSPPPPKDDTPSWFNAVAAIPAPAAAQSAPAPIVNKAPAPAPVVNTAHAASATPMKGKLPDHTEDRFKEERMKAARMDYTEQEYNSMLNTPFSFMNSELNGTMIRDVVELLRKKDPEAGKIVQRFVKNKPMQTHLIPVWKVMVSYLTKENLIQFYPTGNFFVGSK